MYGHRLIRELLGLLFLFCGLLMLLSLWTYDVSDPTFNQAVSIKASSIQNSAGLFGAYLAGFLVDLFGVTSFLWVLSFLAMGAGLVSRWLVVKWYRWPGYLMLFCVALVVASEFDVPLHGIHGGGLLGAWLCAVSYVFLSPTGSVLFWLFVFLIAMELAFSVSWLTLFGGLFGLVASRLSSGREKVEDDAVEDARPSRLPRLFGPKKKEGERRRPVLDIMLADSPSASGDAPEPEALLTLPDASSGPVDAPAAPEGGEEAEDLSRLIVFPDGPAVTAEAAPEAPAPDNALDGAPLSLSPEAPASAGQEAEEAFLLEAEDIVPVPAAPEVPAGDDAGADDEDGFREDDLPPAGLAALSVPGFEPADDMPAAFTGKEEGGSPAAEAAAEAQDADPSVSDDPFDGLDDVPEKDEAYASVDAAVAAAMREQQEIEAACRPAEEPERPAFSLPKRREIALPSMDLLAPLPEEDVANKPDTAMLAAQGGALITCLKNFNVNATLAKITPGPVVTMFEVRPAPGVKATRITNLANDLAMSLKAQAVRMLAPVPGTDTVGVEVPNEKRATVHYREIVENDGFRQAKSLLTVALGKDTGGRPVSADLAKMPHLLVAGATGAGKSVCLNAIILSLLYRARPDEVQMILVDPKQVELSMYADLPHLVHPVVTDMDLTKNALLWAIDEMNRRLKLFAKVKVRNITGYNERQARLRDAVQAGGPFPVDAETGEPEDLTNMPFLVIIVDELADLMMVKRKEVEGSIVRLAQLARAAGIHLIIATQRPSVDVVTGLIKANFPCRIAFKVTSGQDSRTILDNVGAEKLLGMGDMLFKPNGGQVQRLHGAFVSDDEVNAVVEYWKKQQAPSYKVDFSEFGNEDEDASEGAEVGARSGGDDPIYGEAVEFVLSSGKVSISQLQRRFSIGFNRAARYVEMMERDGIITPPDGTRPRSVVGR